MRHSYQTDTAICNMTETAPSSALHRFFASSFPLPVSQMDSTATVCRVVEDNAKGLPANSSASERRRLQDARRTKIQLLYNSRHTTKPNALRSSSTTSATTKLSRWESEVPDLSKLTASPPAPTRRRSLGAMPVPQKEVAPEGISAPQIPRRRTSLLPVSQELSEDLEGHRRAPVMPLRLSINLPSLVMTNVEGNTCPAKSENHVPPERLRVVPRSSKTRSTVPKKSGGRTSPVPESLDTFLSRKSSLKKAPRPPRRMKSMELNEDGDEDTMSTSVSDECDSFRYPVKPMLQKLEEDTDPVRHFHLVEGDVVSILQ